MKREALAKKIMVIGIDGMDPRLTRKYVDEGKMPNVKRLLELGAARKDLVLLGGVPTVTPPMWTTLATGAYPVTHGITCYYRQPPFEEGLDMMGYNLDSSLCKAEQIWNVTAEAGLKTLVWHWPGASWPPSSDSPHLHVIDGTQPAVVNMGVAQVEAELLLVASTRTDSPVFKEKAARDANVPCVITDLEVVKAADAIDLSAATLGNKPFRNIIMDDSDGSWGISDAPFDIVMSPIKEAHGWEDADADALEFTMLLSGGFIRRPCLILKNEQGQYDHIALYKTKKEQEPLVVIHQNEFVVDVIDEALKDDAQYTVNRNMRLLELKPDGSYLKMWISGAMDIHNDLVWHPQKLYREVTENVGYPPADSMLGAGDQQLIVDCMIRQWDVILDWDARAINHLIEVEDYDMVFSQVHNVDGQGHMIVKYLKNRSQSKLDEKAYQKMFERTYIQTDEYVGRYLHLLDKGWTLFLVSDHAQVSPEHKPPLLGDGGCNVGVMCELGFTALKKDAQGKTIREIDWSQTKAVATRMSHIYINLTSRWEKGIVDPKDQYELEEEIMTALYGYRDKTTNKRVVALALRNKDAVILGQGGPEAGDIIYFLAEGYNFDHADSLPTTYGYADTSVSPIFIAAGPGIKAGETTERIIRQTDVAPTIALLAGLRMPAQCEGAPVYQIIDWE